MMAGSCCYCKGQLLPPVLHLASAGSRRAAARGRGPSPSFVSTRTSRCDAFLVCHYANRKLTSLPSREPFSAARADLASYWPLSLPSHAPMESAPALLLAAALALLALRPQLCLQKSLVQMPCFPCAAPPAFPPLSDRLASSVSPPAPPLFIFLPAVLCSSCSDPFASTLQPAMF
jgi:hypothetical protein